MNSAARILRKLFGQPDFVLAFVILVKTFPILSAQRAEQG